jgi:uncharacterized membrane protein YiaA
MTLLLMTIAALVIESKRLSRPTKKIVGFFLLVMGLILFVFGLRERNHVMAALGWSMMLLGLYFRNTDRLQSIRDRKLP